MCASLQQGLLWICRRVIHVNMLRALQVGCRLPFKRACPPLHLSRLCAARVTTALPVQYPIRSFPAGGPLSTLKAALRTHIRVIRITPLTPPPPLVRRLLAARLASTVLLPRHPRRSTPAGGSVSALQAAV